MFFQKSIFIYRLAVNRQARSWGCQTLKSQWLKDIYNIYIIKNIFPVVLTLRVQQLLKMNKRMKTAFANSTFLVSRIVSFLVLFTNVSSAGLCSTKVLIVFELRFIRPRLKNLGTSLFDCLFWSDSFSSLNFLLTCKLICFGLNNNQRI